MNKLSLTAAISETYKLARPYGRRRLALVLGVVLIQGALQVIGVASVLPFLAIASAPETALETRLGQAVTEYTGISDSRTLVIWAGVASALMILLSSVLNVFSEYVRARYNTSFVHWLRLRMMRHYATLPYSFFVNKNSGILIRSITNYVNLFSTTIVAPLLTAIAAFCTASLLILAVFFVQPLLTTVSAAGMVLAFVGMFLILNPMMQSNTRQLKAVNNKATIAIQNFFHGMKPIKVHSVADEIIDSYGRHSLTQSRLLARIPVFACIPRHLLEPIAFGGVILYVVAMTANDQSLTSILPTLGFLAFVGYRTLPAIQIVYTSLSRVVTASYVVEELVVDLEEVRETEIKPSQSLPELSWNHQIEFNDVSFIHVGAETPSLDHVNLVFPKGKKTGVIGTTGSGKSTLVDMLLGLQLPTQGEMKIDDTPYTPSLAKAWRSKIGYVPQEIFLMDETILANIALGVPADEIDVNRVREVCGIAQILDFIDGELPEQFETIVGERGVRLSGGQRQRIGLARALYHQPEIIVLDEATSALDVTTESAFMDAVLAISGETTFIIVAHRLSTIQDCDYVVTLDSGSVVSRSENETLTK